MAALCMAQAEGQGGQQGAGHRLTQMHRSPRPAWVLIVNTTGLGVPRSQQPLPPEGGHNCSHSSRSTGLAAAVVDAHLLASGASAGDWLFITTAAPPKSAAAAALPRRRQACHHAAISHQRCLSDPSQGCGPPARWQALKATAVPSAHGTSVTYSQQQLQPLVDSVALAVPSNSFPSYISDSSEGQQELFDCQSQEDLHVPEEVFKYAEQYQAGEQNPKGYHPKEDMRRWPGIVQLAVLLKSPIGSNQHLTMFAAISSARQTHECCGESVSVMRWRDLSWPTAGGEGSSRPTTATPSVLQKQRYMELPVPSGNSTTGAALRGR